MAVLTSDLGTLSRLEFSETVPGKIVAAETLATESVAGIDGNPPIGVL